MINSIPELRDIYEKLGKSGVCFSRNIKGHLNYEMAFILSMRSTN